MAHSVFSQNLVVLLAAAALLYNTLRGLTAGSAILVFRVVTRSEDGYLYWVAVLGSVLLALVGVLTVIL